jgi:hypothetical protein
MSAAANMPMADFRIALTVTRLNMISQTILALNPLQDGQKS